jgi:hypothetical protein
MLPIFCVRVFATSASVQNGVCNPVGFPGEIYLADLEGTFSKGPSAGPFSSFPSGVKREP